MANQFGRKATLVVSAGLQPGSPGLDLSEMRFRFQTRNADEQAPNTLYVRIYNLAASTVQKLSGKEFSSITLQAGYEDGNFGIIFQGDIKQVATGRERNVDSYVDIWAADGDQWYNFAVISQSITAGQSPQRVIESIVNATSINGVAPLPFASDASGLIEGAGAGTAQALSRGKVKFGMARDFARDWANKYGYRWSIQNGQFVVVPITGYRPGQAVVLSSTTGLIGVPEATADGVRVRALINPLINIGGLVQIQQSDINQITMQQQGLQYSPAVATVTTAQGFYRVLVAEHIGDTRGNDWYVDMVCLAVDISAPNQNNSVSAYG